MCFGMRLIVDFHQAVNSDMGIFLCGREGRVAEQFLNGAQVRTPFQHVGGKSMPQGVRRDILIACQPLHMGVNEAGNTAAIDPVAAGVRNKGS